MCSFRHPRAVLERVPQVRGDAAYDWSPAPAQTCRATLSQWPLVSGPQRWT